MNNDITKAISESYDELKAQERNIYIIETCDTLDFCIKEAMKTCISLGHKQYEYFRPYSDKYFEMFRALRETSIYSCDLEKVLVEETDIGEMGVYEGVEVPLDIPIQEAEYQGKEVELNKPKRGGSKKFYVYVKNDKGNVIKVSFGDTTGLSAKINDKEARKSFAARHKCSQAKDKTKASYWSCRLPRYAKELGLEGGGNFFW
jgi:hypothetical protein